MGLSGGECVNRDSGSHKLMADGQVTGLLAALQRVLSLS